MHLFCIKLMTILISLTLINYSQSSSLPTLLTNLNPSQHHNDGSPSAFHHFTSSSSSSFSSSQSSLSPSHLISSLSVSDVEASSDDKSDPAFDIQNIDNNNNNNKDRFNLLSKPESHEKSQSVTDYVNQQQVITRSSSSSILLPKIYPSSSPVISDPFTSSISFPSHSINPDEGKSLDYATTLIREALEGPMMHDSNGDQTDYVEPGSISSSISTDFDGTMMGERKNEPEISIGVTDRKGHLLDRGESEDGQGEPGSSLNGDENQVQPSEDQLFSEVQKLIQYIRESAAHSDDKGSSPKSRNNRNRLTLQMDYLQNLLNEYRQKQGSINLRHWVRGVSPPRLSVTSPIAVLRDALMEEIKRKKIQETQAKIALNEKILKEVG